MARLRPIPQNREALALLSRAAGNALAAAETLHRLLEGFPGSRDLAEQVRALELEGDGILHDAVRLLYGTPGTALDRVDLYELAMRLDDVCDAIDDVADGAVRYGLRSIRPAAIAQAGVLRRACAALAAAVDTLDGRRDPSDEIARVRALENEADVLLRDAVASLFAEEHDVLVVLRWKDVHERLEDAVDACEQAVHVIEAASLKHR